MEEDDIVARQAKEMEAKLKEGGGIKKKPMLLKNKQEVPFFFKKIRKTRKNAKNIKKYKKTMKIRIFY